MAGLGLFDQKNATAATTPIVTASKFCINLQPEKVSFLIFD
jgi:hypothetical protein